MVLWIDLLWLETKPPASLLPAGSGGIHPNSFLAQYMKLSFSWKLGIITTLLSVCLTSVCVYALYVVTYKSMVNQIGKHLLQAGRLGLLLLGEEDRAALKRLIDASDKESRVSKADIDAMKDGTTLPSLSKEDSDRHHASEDFLRLKNLLSMITLSTIQDMEPRQAVYQNDKPQLIFQQGALAAYISSPIKESPDYTVTKYIASPAPDPTADGWPGNPIGNLTKGFTVQASVINGKSFVAEEIYSDEFYSSLSALFPIIDKDGTLIALLGLDYAATEERNKLTVLRYFCFALILGSLLLSVVSSYYMAKRLGASLNTLTDAARRVSANDLSASVDIRSNDEFSMLGKVFNQMVANIRNYLRDLQEKNNQIATVVLDMHDGVGAIFTSITLASEKNIPTAQSEQEATGLKSINNLAREGLTEVRFLMNALDCGAYDFSTLFEEIEMQSADILAPSKISFELARTGEFPEISIAFQHFLDLQRIFREIFVNIAKHSNATQCILTVQCTGEEILFHLADNGSMPPEQSGSGRGLKSMSGRASRLGGSLRHYFEDGFHVVITLPLHFQEKETGQAVQTSAETHLP